MAAAETDLILEAKELWRPQPGDPGKLPGVSSREYLQNDVPVTEVKVLNAQGSEAVGKPIGTYLTLSLPLERLRERSGFHQAAQSIAQTLKTLLPKQDGSALVVGIGNRAVTPDALGPKAIDATVVTRHLVRHMPDTFGSFRPVAALATGVLGTTGVESSELVQAVCARLHPTAVIAVDALAARSAERLGCTVQFSDSGIIPGSGVGNARAALNTETAGCPVIAVGVPTVVRATALAEDLCPNTTLPDSLKALVVTPKDIDLLVDNLSKVLGFGIDLALQDDLTVEDVEMLLS